jgi:hypothetical protein
LSKSDPTTPASRNRITDLEPLEGEARQKHTSLSQSQKENPNPEYIRTWDVMGVTLLALATLWALSAATASCTSARFGTARCTCTPGATVFWPVTSVAAVGGGYNDLFSVQGDCGATGPFAFSLLSGVLPPGLFLDSNGVLAGTLSMAGSFDFVVQAVNGNSESGSRACSLTVSSSAPSGTTPSDVVVGVNETVVMVSSLTIGANLTVLGGMYVSSSSVTIANGTMDVAGSLQEESGAIIQILGALVIESNASLRLIIVANPGNVSSMSMTVISYAFVVGTFGPRLVSVLGHFAGSDAVTFVDPVLSYGSSTLTALIGVQAAGANSGASLFSPSQALSAGAIAGIAVGCAVAAAIVVVVIILSTRRFRDSEDRAANAAIAKADLDAVRGR